MAARLTDGEIAALIAEVKPLSSNYRTLIQTRAKRGHKERDVTLTGAGGSLFKLILRQSSFNQLDFSVILGYIPPQSNQLFRVRRYNGKSHEHSNIIEGDTFYDFHIHSATKRYQDRGMREDSYARPTDRFADFEGAVRCLLDD